MHTVTHSPIFHRLRHRQFHSITRFHKSQLLPRSSATRLTLPPPHPTTSSTHSRRIHTSPPALFSSTSTTMSAQELTQQIKSHHSSISDASALANTAAFLQNLSASASASTSTLSFDPITLLLKPVFPSPLSQPTDDGGDANHELQALTQLAVDAQQRAFAESHSSALVGEGNEADDMSDIAFWVPAREEGEDPLSSAANPDGIARGLGLDGVGETSEPEPARIVPDGVRLTVTGLPDSRVIVLEGRRVAGGWAGLVGVGVWS
ncbi:hypothetical protein D9619_001422 [Psilocybe cf. subviscida]|uniref:Uncharacterized protein n=1 Tax=Psilocybe cf. subviscida TaxID=2480587 RepID=A0A8H5F2Q4_9AGAR|nr:hypothetical protein D9619_001422 [Psilocybe cf. subviscida]